jgi:phytoene synthase
MTPSEAQDYCSTLTKGSGSNFYYSFLFLPKPKRHAMYTVYAFCHEVDDAVDDPGLGNDPQEQLNSWRAELTAAYQGHPTHAVTISLAEHARRLHIPKEYFEELIAGMEMDLTMTRYPSFDDLSLYCYRVASIVGLICLKVFGTTSPQARDYAIALGKAFQLTNILRDLKPDADRGRIYLPQEELAKFNCDESTILEKRYTPSLLQLLKFQCARARDYYEKAHSIFKNLPASDRKALTPAEIMRAVYSRILDQIEASEYQVFGPRISLPSSQRLLIACGVWLRAQFPLLHSRPE